MMNPKKTAGGTRPGQAEIVTVTADNLEEQGFFCYMSKRKTEGYARKQRWLRDRLAEDLGLKLLVLPERGFIEYLPGEFSWRAVRADGYMMIHCLWVVGRSKGRGFGAALLGECVGEAKRLGMKGVAMVTSEKNWLAGRKLLAVQGFECAAEAAPAFSLMVKKFGKGPSPEFAGGWEDKARAFGRGLTVVRSDQCPYIVDATAIAVGAAKKAGIRSRVVELRSREDVLRLSPTPYGVFSLVLDGNLLSYHYELEKDLLPLLRAAKR
ncbi:MAG: GNAT family N-acetyltransferase [Candidatus Aminicenantes bacterium]|nr:GNAT family N-acetyltransferase [Candidatus Aminicenantes bacterium]